jgi:hypothetical protein
VTAIGRPNMIRPGWIVYSLFVLNPIVWLLGLGGFVWSLAVLPLAVWVLLRPGLERPPTVALYTVYVVWAGFSAVRLDRASRLLTFGFRYAAYLSALLLAYYVYNERRVTREKFVNWVAMFWVWAIAGGYLGLLIPRGRLKVTLASVLLPNSIAGNEFVGNLVRPRFAQVQNIFGVSIPRPATLFAFTNEWGGNVGLLTPFFVAATLYSPDPKRRRLGVIGLLLSIPPMLVSVNRGLWISVAAILTIVAIRSFLVGRTAPLKFLAGGIMLLVGLLLFTPLGSIVSGRLSESDAGARAGIYQEAWDGALRSPILGYGGPRPSINPFSPAVGTHGHIWFAMFSHGLVGLGLYVSWVIWSMYSVSRRHDPVSIMLASVVFVGGLQMFFYSLLPASLPIILVAIGLSFRPDDDVRAVATVHGATTPAPLGQPIVRGA